MHKRQARKKDSTFLQECQGWRNEQALGQGWRNEQAPSGVLVNWEAVPLRVHKMIFNS